jgi:hypothetical protein
MTNPVTRRAIRVGEVPSSNLGAPIVFKNREHPRIAAQVPKTLGAGEGGIRGDSGMFAGIGTAEGPQQRPKRTAEGPQVHWVTRLERSALALILLL